MSEEISIESKMVQLEAKMDAVLASSEKTRKYLLWSLVIPLVFFVLPLLAIPFIVPLFLQSLSLPPSF